MKVLFLTDLKKGPNLALAKLAQHETNQGNQIYTKYQNPDKIYCSWIFKKNIDGQVRLDAFNRVEIIEGGYFFDPTKTLPDNIEHLMPYYPLTR